jgi:hypothetical protein
VSAVLALAGGFVAGLLVGRASCPPARSSGSGSAELGGLAGPVATLGALFTSGKGLLDAWSADRTERELGAISAGANAKRR